MIVIRVPDEDGKWLFSKGFDGGILVPDAKPYPLLLQLNMWLSRPVEIKKSETSIMIDGRYFLALGGTFEFTAGMYLSEIGLEYIIF